MKLLTAITSPVRGIAKAMEPASRVMYLLPPEEAPIWKALLAELRSLFAVSVNTGLPRSRFRGTAV